MEYTLKEWARICTPHTENRYGNKHNFDFVRRYFWKYFRKWKEIYRGNGGTLYNLPQGKYVFRGNDCGFIFLFLLPYIHTCTLSREISVTLNVDYT